MGQFKKPKEEEEIKYDPTDDLETVIALLNQRSIPRYQVQHELEIKIPNIADFYKSYLMSFRKLEDIGNIFINLNLVRQMLDQLIDLIYNDFVTNLNCDWIEILINNGISPISRQQCELHIKKNQLVESKELSEAKKIEKATFLSRQQRSNKRKEFHRNLFKSSPSFYVSNITEKRLQRLILQLTANNAVISPKIDHWTNLTSFKNMLRNDGTILGNGLLRKNSIYFIGSALTSSDIEETGDEHVICFSPYLVDPMALVNEYGTLRDKLIRITIDLNRLESATRIGKYNQFFKLCDFGAPQFENSVHINEQLSFVFFKEGAFKPFFVYLTFKGKRYRACIENHESIFYGSLSGINRFCLLKLFDLLDNFEKLNTKEEEGKETKDENFTAEFYDYLSKLTDNEIKKILIVFAQNLTVHSEYNFNAVLKLTDGLISEIYIAEKNQVIEMSNLDSEQYRGVLKKIVSDDIKKLPTCELPYLLVEADSSFVTLHKVSISQRARNFTFQQDLRNISAAEFSGKKYLETRPGSDDLDLIVKNNSKMEEGDFEKGFGM